MKKLVLFALVGSSVAASLVACGTNSFDAITSLPLPNPNEGGSAPDSGRSDASGDDASGDDAGLTPSADGGDATPGTTPDADGSDSGMEPVLLATDLSGFTIVGITTDGFVIYYNSSSAVHAAPVGGGAPISVFASGVPDVAVYGSAVYALGAITGPCAEQRPLLAWTAAGGATTISSRATTFKSAQDLAVVSTNGLLFAYQAWSDSACSSREVDVGLLTIPGGEFPARPSSTCAGYPGEGAVWPSLAPDGTLLTTAYCGNDAGTSWQSDLFAVSSDASNIGRVRTIASFAGAGQLDATGAWMWLPNPAGGAQLVKTSTGSVVASDPAALPWALFDPGDAHAYYLAGSALVQLDLSTAPPTRATLASTVQNGTLAIDPNGAFVLDDEWSSTSAEAADAGTSLVLRSTSGQGTSTFVAASGINELAGYTADGSFAFATEKGVLTSIGTTAGSSATTVASGVAAVSPVRDTRVLASFDAGPPIVFDLSGARAPWTFDPRAVFATVAPGGRSIVYTTGGVSPMLYAITVP